MAVKAKTIRLKAMDLLARREHSVKELLKKLSDRFEEPELIIKVVDQLAQDNLVSNSRFAEMYVRSRVNRQFGPIRIKHDLRERGVSDFQIDSALDEANPDWFQLIQELSVKKYGHTVPSEVKETAKRVRFFQSRGFDSDSIRFILQ
ncbi:recombination regulator RecX [Gammaproteobacteria bacterium]|nr:recombination regulator RecX [Gammaproteobacteria bacterium]|tara:strand:- start:2099 stop:2539 length:441 start_codon:yes stop_codon:yes gene_type:complete